MQHIGVSCLDAAAHYFTDSHGGIISIEDRFRFKKAL